MTAPKAFVSYSWTTPEHEERVRALATELRQSGVDVILDKWDPKEGHDANVFMEQMVTDQAVTKVLLICDKAYVAKANGRMGGVGTETQIVSGEVFKSKGQDKFVAVVMECDEDGIPCRPAYYGSRIYVNFTDPSTYSENFEQLLRWIFDKPLYVKPELGKPPEFLSAKDGATVLATSSRYKRALDAVSSNKPYAVAAIAEYFDLLADQLERLRIPSKSDPFDDAVIASIESFLPHRNEAIELFLAIGLHLDTPDTRDQIHRLFERLLPYINRPEGVNSGGEGDCDNFKFIVHELFLYAIASLLRHERFAAAAHLLVTEYYAPDRSNHDRGDMISFSVFRSYLKSLETRNNRLQLQRLSIHADLLKQRCTGIVIKFRQVMQADFVIFLWVNLHGSERWWPVTLLYSSHDFGAGVFEIFARSQSLAYFNKVRALLGIQAKGDLEQLLKKFDSNEVRLPKWEFDSINPRGLLAFDAIGTKP